MGDEGGVSRRSFTVGLLVALTAACNPARDNAAEDRSDAAGRAQGGDPAGTGTSGDGGSASADTRSQWDLFQARFVDPSGRVVDTGNNQVSHSEGQGYGLLFALNAGDRSAFEAISGWTERTLLRKDVALHAWKFDPHSAVPVSDPNNATDGDILIAWALAGAARRWGVRQWGERSAAIRAAIRQRLVVERYGYRMLVPGLEGFVLPQKILLNPSYFIWPALDSFAALDGHAAWSDVANDCARIVSEARFGVNQLPTDWIEVTEGGQVAPAQGRDPRFGFDAIRVPLHAIAAHRAELVAPIANYWRSYRNHQQPIPAWTDVITGEVAPYPLSEGGEAIADRLIGGTAPAQLSNDYYAASLQLLVQGLR